MDNSPHHCSYFPHYTHHCSYFPHYTVQNATPLTAQSHLFFFYPLSIDPEQEQEALQKPQGDGEKRERRGREGEGRESGGRERGGESHGLFVDAASVAGPLPREEARQPETAISFRCLASAGGPDRSPRPKPFDLKTYWVTLIAEINQKLDEAIPVQYPERIYEAMRYSVLADGAKGAPPVMCVTAGTRVMCVTACELFGGNRLAAFPTACALEMVPAASLIHDDLPCMDDDPSRHAGASHQTTLYTVLTWQS